MENSNDFERGKDLWIEFSEKSIKGSYIIPHFCDPEKKVTHTVISLPGQSLLSGYCLDTTNIICQPKDRDGNVKKGRKSIRVYENAEYRLVRTPKGENGRLDYSKQSVRKISGSELKKEMEAWKTEYKRTDNE